MTTQLAVPAMAPELIAVVVSKPWRWKNRTRTPNTAASPPTSEVNMLDVSRATHRPYGIGPATAPVTAQASLSTGSWASTKASATQSHSAPRMTSSEPDASDSTPTMAHRPIRLPSTMARLAQLIRLASTSLGTSTPAAAARDWRSAGSRPFCDLAIRTVAGSSVDRCSWVRMAWMVAVSRTWVATAVTRSVPASTAAAATAAARSRSVRPAGAEDEARRKSRRHGPSGVTTTVCGLSAPCAMPAARSASTEVRSWAMNSSLS